MTLVGLPASARSEHQRQRNRDTVSSMAAAARSGYMPAGEPNRMSGSERPQNEYDASAPNILGSPTDTPFTPSEAVSAKPPV
jgi:hypothetical protein